MPFSTVLLAACLDALKWLLWVVVGLLLLMVAAQWLRGEEGRPLASLLLAVAFGFGGLACGAVARALSRAREP